MLNPLEWHYQIRIIFRNCCRRLHKQEFPPFEPKFLYVRAKRLSNLWMQIFMSWGFASRERQRGFLIGSWFKERLTLQQIDAFADKHCFSPLHWAATSFLRSTSFRFISSTFQHKEAIAECKQKCTMHTNCWNFIYLRKMETSEKRSEHISQIEPKIWFLYVRLAQEEERWKWVQHCRNNKSKSITRTFSEKKNVAAGNPKQGSFPKNLEAPEMEQSF